MRLKARLALLAIAAALPVGPLPAQVLWELERDDVRVVLLGSVHLLRPDDQPLGPAVDSAWNSTEVLHTELAADELENPAVGQDALVRFALAGGEDDTLDRSIPESDWSEVAALAEEIGIDPELLRPWQPWYAAMLLTQVRVAQLGFRADLGVESQLLNRAARDGRPAFGLETLAGQFETLASLSADEQLAFLRGSLDDIAEAELMMDRLIPAWKDADLQTLESVLAESVQAMPALYEPLYRQRNHSFAGAIEKMLDGPATAHLVVVGALHLVGEESVPAILEARGHRLRPLH